MSLTNPYYQIRMFFHPDRFYGSHSTIAQLMEGISSFPLPKSFELVGLPGTGKTIHLQYLAHPDGALARSECRRHLSPPFQRGEYRLLPVHVEFRLLPSDTHAFVYLYHRFRQAWREWHEQQPAENISLELPALEEGQVTEETAIKRLETACAQLDRSAIRPVLLLDDFDLPFRRMPEHEATRLRPLRASVSFVIATEQRLNQVNPQAAGSPFFYNIGVIEFRGLDPEEAKRLVHEPAAKAGHPFPDADQQFILRQSGRYPALILRGCEALWDLRRRLNLEDDTPLSEKYRDALLGQLKREFEPLYGLYLRRLTPEERKALTRLAHTPASLSATELEVLGALDKRTGLVEARRDDPALFEFFSPLFAEFVSASAEPRAARPVQTLTGLEARLHQYLQEHAGQTCTFEELHRAIWNHSMGETEREREHARRRIQVAISRLRSKLRVTTGEDIISIRDQGYRLVRESADRSNTISL